MNANFKAINSSFSIDHVAYTAVEDEGMHDVLTFRPQVGDPATNATQSAIYNKLVTSVPQLFFRSNSNATPIQLSNSNLNTFQTGSPIGTQSSFLAGPFTIYMGYLFNVTDGQVVVLTPSSNLIYVGLSTALLFLPFNNEVRVAAPINIAANQFEIHYTFSIPVTVPPTPLPVIYYTAIGI